MSAILRISAAITKFSRAATAFLVFALLTTAAGVASAQTIAELQARKKIVIGVLVDFPPFGIMNTEGKPDGLDIELAKLMAKNLGVEAEIMPVVNANRIPFLQSKRIDVLVASLGVTSERARQVMFTIPYAAVDVVIAAPKKVQLSKIEDLMNVSVAVARGSSQEGYVSSIAPKGAKIQRFDGDGPATQAMLTGQVDALAQNTLMLKSIKDVNPGLDIENKIVLRRQGNSIAVRLDAFELHQWINTFLYQIRMTGELDALHKKWLGETLGELGAF
ncbi:transporter substrate-binding domain-containing protein [Bosea sp. (in: a-proteobacteria)]|uniref:transporter substrate-binding domain-containing protein n=1 Tax=Bosea sp. (in: a-proteobacteria) TaxID=1871050 RepID=UPI00260AC95F|nr:transporter substrate-binding domain-containing protein [Bosea sp. (in: a-proteobacteria)]MCO5089819.1 transporter substrate-binding domain-containing protein [Bosea sp. (in: a-proteobacteria)]